jgi:hypothetical protein
LGGCKCGQDEAVGGAGTQRVGARRSGGRLRARPRTEREDVSALKGRERLERLPRREPRQLNLHGTHGLGTRPVPQYVAVDLRGAGESTPMAPPNVRGTRTSCSTPAVHTQTPAPPEPKSTWHVHGLHTAPGHATSHQHTASHQHPTNHQHPASYQFRLPPTRRPRHSRHGKTHRERGESPPSVQPRPASETR